MKLYLFIHYIFCMFLIGYLFYSKQKYKEIYVLLISALDGIPIIMLGNSPSSAIFISDIILSIILVKALFFKMKLNNSYYNKKSNNLLNLLVFWIIFVSIIAFSRPITRNGYETFIVYGVFRWVLFIFYLKVFFSKQYSNTDKESLVKSLLKILGVFGVILLLHQLGIINLTGIESMGSRIGDISNLYAEHDFKQTFMAINKVNLGSIVYTSIWISIYALGANILSKKEKIYTVLLLVLFSVNLINTWSRSDVLGLAVSIIMLFIISNKKVKNKIILLGYFIIIVFCIIVLLYINNIIDIDLSTFNFFMKIFDIEKGEGSGGYRLLIFESTLNYLKENPVLLLTGLGPNGFRIMHELTGFKANFGHNTYLHNVVELGIIGASLVLSVLVNYIILFWSKIKLNKNKFAFNCVLAYFIGKCVTGLSVDIFFAIDSMLFSNVTLIGFFALVITSGNHELRPL